MKTNTNSTSCCFGWLQALVILCVHSFYYIAPDSPQRPTSSVWRRYCRPGSRGGQLEDPTTGNRTQCYTSRRTQSFQSNNFCCQITTNIWPSNSVDSYSHDYYEWGTVEWETKTKDELKAMITAVFSNLNKVLFTNPSARAEYDTRSIFKRSLTGLNSEFSFF